MKKLFIGVAMVLALGLVANVAFSDETLPFPFWQHGWSLMSFWSVTNDTTSSETVTVTIVGKLADGSVHFSTTSTIDPGLNWAAVSYESWYTHGDGYGFGEYVIEASADTVHLWGAIFAIVTSSGGNSQPGYTIIMPGNPYGMP